MDRQELLSKAYAMGIFAAAEEHTDQELRDAISQEEEYQRQEAEGRAR